jgi:hypothetical protein
MLIEQIDSSDQASGGIHIESWSVYQQSWKGFLHLTQYLQMNAGKITGIAFSPVHYISSNTIVFLYHLILDDQFS